MIFGVYFCFLFAREWFSKGGGFGLMLVYFVAFDLTVLLDLYRQNFVRSLI